MRVDLGTLISVRFRSPHIEQGPCQFLNSIDISAVSLLRRVIVFTTFPLSLKALLNDVQSGKIQLPDFQRGWVWDEDRIQGLLASISRGFPVGAVMTLSAGGQIRFKTRLVEGVSANAISLPDRFLLDGQQRLTSLYQALLHPDAVSTQDTRGQKRLSWFYIDMRLAVSDAADREDAVVVVPKDKKITRDFGRKIDLDLSCAEFEYEKLMFPTEKLFDPLKWTLNYTTYWEARADLHPEGNATEFFSKFNDGVIKPFADYLLPVIHLEKEDSEGGCLHRIREGQHRRSSAKRLRARDCFVRC